MPNTASATKALRQSKRKKASNDIQKVAYRKAIKEVRTTPSAEALTAAYSKVDLAAKKNVITKKKADRIKSRLSRLVQ